MGKSKKEKIIVSANRFEVGFQLLNKWLMLHQQDKTLEKYFVDNNLSEVAIYGMGALGERLFQDLRNIGIEIKYCIDRAADNKKGLDVTVYSTAEVSYPKVDAIIVTPIQDYWSIVKVLEAKTDVPVLSLEDVVEYCL